MTNSHLTDPVEHLHRLTGPDRPEPGPETSTVLEGYTMAAAPLIRDVADAVADSTAAAGSELEPAEIFVMTAHAALGIADDVLAGTEPPADTEEFRDALAKRAQRAAIAAERVADFTPRHS